MIDTNLAQEYGIELTPQLQHKICAYVEQSVPPKQAAFIEHVPEALFDIWMASVPSFNNAIKRAEATGLAEIICKQHVQAANGNKGAGQYLLANRYQMGTASALSAEIMSKIVKKLEKELPAADYTRVLKILRGIKF